MKKITLMKTRRQTESLRLLELTEAVELIRSRKFDYLLEDLRRYYPLYNLQRHGDDTGSGAKAMDKVPRLCFASELENRNHQRVSLGYTAMVLLEVNNLRSIDEAEAVRRAAGEVPYTLLAFVGASGRSVKIVCRGEFFRDEAAAAAKLPWGVSACECRERETIALFHENLYERARLTYDALLGVTVEKLEPRLDRTCHMSADAGAVFNPTAVPFYARAEKPTEALATVRHRDDRDDDGTGQSCFVTQQHIFEFNLSKAYDECEGLSQEEHRHALLTRLALHCMKTGIPLAVAKQMTRYKMYNLGTDDLLIETVFSNVYQTENSGTREGGRARTPDDSIPYESLLMMKIDRFLNDNYDIRKNVMRGVAEFRERSGVGFAYRDLTEEACNSITMRALLQGIKCWDKDIRRYLNSEDIRLYDPLNDYLEGLPKWDGHDRVTALARRVPNSCDEWPELFHIWMRAMVAMWMRRGQLSGNALVPLLIGRQGCGKSSFCRILLPYQLRHYYNDNINFKNETDLNLALTSFGMINLDEFDKMSQRQQVMLKYLASTADVNYRRPHGKAYLMHRRFASFIGTTNEPTPLTDALGARRFVCVTVEGDIDFRSPIDYEQLYAQLKQEVTDGERYWPTREQEQALISQNEKYQQVSGLQRMLMSVIQQPDNDENGQWMTISDVSALLKKRFKDYKEDTGTFYKIGRCLNQTTGPFKSKRLKTGMTYWVKVRK